MRAVFFETAAWERSYLTRALAPLRLRPVFVPEPLTDATRRLAAQAEIVSVFIYSALTAALLRRLKPLRLVATRSTGFDHIHLAPAGPAASRWPTSRRTATTPSPSTPLR